MSTVFISSTKTDLNEYREAAVEICHRLGLRPIAMENFEAEGADGATGSKRQLDGADVYVGIIAYRYGRVTEIEFDYAGERDIERICLVADKNYSWPVDRIDFKNQEALETFKARLSDEVLYNEFTTVDDFRVKLMQALVCWMNRNNIGTQQDDDTQSSRTDRVLPLRPALLVGRLEDTQKIKARFVIPSPDNKQELTIIRGWPGVGKTTLINSLAYDEDITATFTDGILWAELGENGNPFSELTSWGRQLGDYEIDQVTSLNEAITRLQVVLRNKNILLIVDDVWEADHGVPFKLVSGSNCHLLMSTRFPEVAKRLANVPGDIYLLDVLDDHEAVKLLSELAPTVTEDHPEKSLELVRNIEWLPLAIRVAGRLLDEEARLGFDVVSLMKEIGESRRLLGENAPDDRFDPRTGTTPTIDFLLKRSTDSLDEITRDRFAVLGAFAPKPATFDLKAVTFMWKIEQDETTQTVRKLVNRGLLEPIPTINRYQMHAILVMHAQSLLEGD